jgi:hypothetical protein
MPSKYRYDNGRNGRSKSGGSSGGSSDGRNGRSKSGGSSDVGAGRRERSQRPHRSEKKGRSNHPIYRDQKENIYIAGFEEDNALDSPEPVNYHNMTQQQLEHRRQEEFADQDAMLDQIHHGVKGLKNHAHAINGEIVEQNAMIDDIGNVCFVYTTIE